MAGGGHGRLVGPVPQLHHRADHPASRRGPGFSTLSTSCVSGWPPWTTSAAACRTPPRATAAAAGTRCSASAGSCGGRDRLSTKARARLQAGLIAGDPDGEVTLTWTVAQDLMNLYRLDDPDLARTRAAALIIDLRECPIGELARLGRTLHAWRVELCAHFDHADVSNGPTENLNLKIKNAKRTARGYRNFDHYRLRLLLNHGRIHQDHSPTRIRTRAPRFAA
ncbi:ISL3 family transposase [Pseudonocardia sp. RS010]|uniref:ISL3 family transposase n=1 Tax=Pseudonocardia sp. RS010 TaxID=3385979 RepID=UPI0039A372E5